MAKKQFPKSRVNPFLNYLKFSSLGLLGVLVTAVLCFQFFPEQVVIRRYPKLKFTDNFETKRGWFKSYVANISDPCSGIACPVISCFEVSFWQVSFIGTDAGRVTEPVQLDFKNCQITNKLPQLDSKNIDVSTSDSTKFKLRYTAGNLELVTPLKPIQLPEISDQNLKTKNVVWAEDRNLVYLSYIKENSDPKLRSTYVAMISLKSGNILKELPIESGFYGAANDFAFPLVINPVTKMLAIQSNYIQSFTVLSPDLLVVKNYQTSWAEIEMFSQEMFDLDGYTMFLDYRWLDNQTLEYKFSGSNNTKYIRMN